MKKYYIYHIPGVKIGCSTQPKQRVEKQGYTDFQILETHTDIDIASKRELQLQKEWGYKVDTSLYKQSVNNRPKWKKEWSDKGRETMLKNGFFKEWYKKGVAARSKAVAKYDKITGELIQIFDTVSDAARSIDRLQSTSAISACCNGTKKSYMGYKWKYFTDNQDGLPL